MDAQTDAVEADRHRASESRARALLAAAEHQNQMAEIRAIPNAEATLRRVTRSAFGMERFVEAIEEGRASSWLRAHVAREASEARRARLEMGAAVDATESAADAAIARLEAARLAGIARLAPDTGNGADAWQLYKSVV